MQPTITTWMRHLGDSRFHAIEAAHQGSIVTRCNGRWAIDDEFVEESPSPPHLERCELCQRLAIEATRIERGLAELVDNAPVEPDRSKRHRHEHDAGGES